MAGKLAQSGILQERSSEGATTLEIQGWLHHFGMQHLHKVSFFFFPPRKYAEKMSFQSDLINDRKWLTASLLLFQMEKRGERNCLLYLVKIHTQPCITDPLLWLLSKISRLAVTLLSSLAKLQPLDIFYCH